MKKFKALVSLVFLASFIFTLSAQEKAAVNSVANLMPEEENLDVFQQWLKWNNPGSLLLTVSD